MKEAGPYRLKMDGLMRVERHVVYDSLTVYLSAEVGFCKEMGLTVTREVKEEEEEEQDAPELAMVFARLRGEMREIETVARAKCK